MLRVSGVAKNCISCNNCGHTGWSKNRGNFIITLVLAIFFFVPAIIYEIWRRTGLGVCANCGSNMVIPSNSCSTKKPPEVGDILGLSILGVIGCIVVVALYAVINGGPSTEKNIRHYEVECMSEGMKHYQKIGQYPMLPNGTETSTQVLNLCKNSADGNFIAP